MKKCLLILSVSILAGLMSYLQSGHLSILRADEIDEEIQSTIGSDPENRGKKAKPSQPAPASEPAAAPSHGESEEGEWQTMHSESHRSGGGGGGGGSGAGSSSIKVDAE